MCGSVQPLFTNFDVDPSINIFIDVNSEDDVRMRKRRRGLLRMYYGVDDQVPEEKTNPLDIDHNQFKSDMFMEKVLKECSLNELYQMEGKMKKGI